MSKYKEPNNIIYKVNDFNDLPWVNSDNFEGFRNLIDSLDIKSDAKILDIGCGAGAIADYLSTKWTVTAIDVSDVVIRHCKNTYVQNSDIFEALDFLEWNKKNKYDFVVAHLLLHDIQPEDLEAFCKNVSDLVEDKGIILLSWLKQNDDRERECLFNGGKSKVFFHKPENLAIYFKDFYIEQKSDVEITPKNPNIIKKAKEKKVEGFTYQTLIMTKDAIKLQYDILKGSFDEIKEELEKGKICSDVELENKKKDIYKEITEKLYELTLNANAKAKDAKIFYNLQIKENVEPDIKLYPIEDDETARSEKSRAYFLVNAYNNYYDDIHKEDGEQKGRCFLVHSFFQLTNLAANNIKRIDLRKENNDVKIVLQYYNAKNEKEDIFDDFLNKNAKDYDIALYKDYINFLFNETAKNDFVDYLKKKSGESIKEKCPKHYTIWNLSFPNYDYIGTIIVESYEDNKIDIPDDILNEIRNIFHAFKIEYHKCENELAKTRIRQKSIQSAISAIMSRNMSHNLGSHFITNTKNYIATQGEKYKDTDMPLAADLRGIRHVLQYTQERMDYIATIVSGDQYPLGALNVKAQLFDELTIDDFAERHDHDTTNFFLKYLVYSEKYSHDKEKDKDFQDIKLQIIKKKGNERKKFTGKKGRDYEGEDERVHYETLENEQDIKRELSELNFAVPGGVMARHALFNIVENIMRNSAKHSKNAEKEDLIITLEIEKATNTNIVKKDYLIKNKEGDYQVKENIYHIRVYDNKKNHDDVVKNVQPRLNNLQTLTNDGTINKENKGLKEMLICVLWLQNEDIAKVLSEIDNTPNDRYKKVEEYFRICKCGEDNNFGYEFELPVWKNIYPLKVNENSNVVEENLTDICADIVCCGKDKVQIINNKNNKADGWELKDIFTRFTKKAETTDYKSLFQDASKNVLKNTELDDYIIYIADNDQKDRQAPEGKPTVIISGKNNNVDITDKHIVFESHLATDSMETKRDKYENIYENAVYVDNISGGDFTKTLTDVDFLTDEIMRCKIVESALTKIAIIDERLFEKFHHRSNSEDKFNPQSDEISIEKLSLNRKNIFLYNIEIEGVNSKFKNLDNDECGTVSEEFSILSIEKNRYGNEVHFLTIHLGLLEKYRDLILDKLKKCKKLTLNGTKYFYNDAEEKEAKSAIITHIMNRLQTEFGTKFIAIHSGRGNFSADLEEDLKDYPFISLSALEAAFDNSKFFLSQLFYNTIYYGKGNINHE
ncbi:MAG: class I SAM-dependent methyltransferase [Prevotellaceae bacterium]|jgi:2-polyprenyl-3-methyl-5-hydroxy-6-metoxy-1,4-benzoquinol methylase|nr:class I SAM-dependent methyltransferase [Prevotellaceae bacterium]